MWACALCGEAWIGGDAGGVLVSLVDGVGHSPQSGVNYVESERSVSNSDANAHTTQPTLLWVFFSHTPTYLSQLVAQFFFSLPFPSLVCPLHAHPLPPDRVCRWAGARLHGLTVEGSAA